MRLNGNTIGSATSGATERANLDTQALFLYLWPDTTLTVSGGRGASAAADWAANKNLALPDWRGYALGALDDMGTIAAPRGGSVLWARRPPRWAASAAAQSYTIITANLPPYTPSGSVSGTVLLGGVASIAYNVTNAGSRWIVQLLQPRRGIRQHRVHVYWTGR